MEQVFVAPGNDGMTFDGLDLVNIEISEHSELIELPRRMILLLGPLSVLDDALAAGIVDDFNQAGLIFSVHLV